MAFITLFKSLIMPAFCVGFSLCDYPIAPLTLITDSVFVHAPLEEWHSSSVVAALTLTAHVVILGEPAIVISLSSPSSVV